MPRPLATSWGKWAGILCHTFNFMRPINVFNGAATAKSDQYVALINFNHYFLNYNSFN